jgi:hypothetical protein
MSLKGFSIRILVLTSLVLSVFGADLGLDSAPALRAASGMCPCSIWSTNAVPAQDAVTDGVPIEVGVKFRSDVPGYITGIRFYKGISNTLTHTATLWSIAGTPLVSATFTSETASGWQQVTFNSPVAVLSNTTYIASYHSPSGYFAIDTGYFTTGVDNVPLHAPAWASGDPNGVFQEDGTGPDGWFPANGTDNNYWVDVTFTTVTWNNPVNIAYGTALGAPQLNATASVSGTFVYSPTGGTILNVGANQLLHVDFTPADTTYYNGDSKDVTINVVKATPVITWATPVDIVYGTALGATQLNATASVVGSFVYVPPAGTVLNVGAGQTLRADFTPADTAHYTSTSKSVTINVVKATPVITWATPVDIVYGTALGVTQLNATASVSGTFVYSPTAGTILNAGANQILHVDFIPDDTTHYSGGSKDVAINVLKRSASVSAVANSKTYGDSDPALATTNNNFVAADLGASKITFSATRAAGESVAGSPYTITPVASDNGTGLLNNYTVTYSTTLFTIAKRSASVSAVANSKTYGDSDPALAATGNNFVAADLGASKIAFSATRAAGESVAGSPYTITPAASDNGTGLLNNYTVTYNSALFTITKATPVITWATPVDIVYGTALGAPQLNATASVLGSFAYTPAAGTVLNAGVGQTLRADFTPTDTANYTATSKSVAITVVKATPTVVVTGGTFAYDGQPHAASGFAYGVGGVSNVLSPAVTFTYNGSGTMPVAAGTYNVVGTFVGNSNYLSATNTATLTITYKIYLPLVAVNLP